MELLLSKCDKKHIESITNYASKNNKVLALRDTQGKILAIGLSISALQTAESKSGFKYYQVKTKKRPLYCSHNDVNEIIIDNNMCAEIITYDVVIQIYEGKRLKRKDQDGNLYDIPKDQQKAEEYWYKCYIRYLNNKDSFSIFDLINKRVEKKNHFYKKKKK